MRQVLLTLVTGAIAGFAGAGVWSVTHGSDDLVDHAESGELARLDQRVAELATAVAQQREARPTLLVPPPARVENSERVRQDVVADVLAELDQRIDERIAEQSEERSAPTPTAASDPRSRKRLSLRDAAKLLELDARQESDLARIYEETERRIIDLMAGPTGDIEQVRQDLAAARGGPTHRDGSRSSSTYPPSWRTRTSWSRSSPSTTRPSWTCWARTRPVA